MEETTSTVKIVTVYRCTYRNRGNDVDCGNSNSGTNTTAEAKETTSTVEIVIGYQFPYRNRGNDVDCGNSNSSTDSAAEAEETTSTVEIVTVVPNPLQKTRKQRRLCN